MAEPLIGLKDTTNGLSGLSGGPWYGRRSGMRPALSFGKGKDQ